MNKLYLFSKNQVLINSKYLANKNSCLCINDYQNENINASMISNSQTFCTTLNFKSSSTNQISSNLRVQTIGNALFCEIIYIGPEEPSQKFCTKNCEVFICFNHIKILTDNKYYCYYFDGENESDVIENNNILYVFNKSNLLEFDIIKKTFCLKQCKKYVKIDKKIEILCKISHNNTYFLLYSLDLSDNEIVIRQYKNNNNIMPPKASLPTIWFHLIKNNFDDAKMFLADNINYDDIKKYICQFDNIFEIDNQYFLSSNNTICKINLKIEGNLIVDVD